MARFNPIIEVQDDGLFLPKAVGPWAERKYNLMGGYAYIFNNAIKNRFINRVYIDLFAGAGYAPIKGRNKIVKSSALISLSLPEPFTHYIFCEMDPSRMDALKERVKREQSSRLSSCYFLEGDSNESVCEVVKIVNSIPGSTISFAFVDPFSLNLHFSTVEKLSGLGKVDFLILLALQMDANRNFIYYSDADNKKVDLFIGRNNWREPFKNMEVNRNDFISYLARVYDENMIHLGYKVNEGLKPKVDAEEFNLALYYLAFYSKHDLGNKFFKEIQKYHIPQQQLF
jgi:three-Cys-motif partner protein